MGNANSVKPHASFGFLDFVWRLIAALFLVMSTYNPSGFSYLHWAQHAMSGEGLMAAHFFIGVILLVGWTVFAVATSRSLGVLGALLGATLIGTGFWFLSQIGLIQAESTRTIVWLVLISLAILLAIGLSWSHVWRRLSGQLEVDDSDS